jgi:hypothetical protein
MMYGSSVGVGFPLAAGLHVLGALAFLVGLAFLLTVAFRSLTVLQLRNWGIGLVVIGILLCLATIATRHAGPLPGEPRGYGGMGDYSAMHDRMQLFRNGQDNDMTMDGMVSGLQGKTGDAFDKAFLSEMIAHHEGAVEMAKLAQQNAKHAEIKGMANDIVSAQQREIDQMKQWQTSWQYAQ